MKCQRRIENEEKKEDNDEKEEVEETMEIKATSKFIVCSLISVHYIYRTISLSPYLLVWVRDRGKKSDVIVLLRLRCKYYKGTTVTTISKFKKWQV